MNVCASVCMCSKSIETEAVFTKIGIDNIEWNVFFKMVPLAFNKHIQASFPLVKAHLKLFFWYSVKLYPCISLNALYVLKTYSLGEFPV